MRTDYAPLDEKSIYKLALQIDGFLCRCCGGIELTYPDEDICLVCKAKIGVRHDA